jgi:hypothetical protein
MLHVDWDLFRNGEQKASEGEKGRNYEENYSEFVDLKNGKECLSLEL